MEDLLKRIQEQYFFIAENNDKRITDFASPDKRGCMCTKIFQNIGIAKQQTVRIGETDLINFKMERIT
jgi:hypothetical protein